MGVEHATWPFSVMGSKWEVSGVQNECQDCVPTNIISKKTGHTIVQVECDATSEKLKILQHEMAQYIVDLHNSQLRK
jgi:hypothetical protein